MGSFSTNILFQNKEFLANNIVQLFDLFTVQEMDVSDILNKIKNIDNIDNIELDSDFIDKIKYMLNGNHIKLYSDNFVEPVSWGTGNMDTVYSPSHAFYIYPANETNAIELGWKLFINGCENPSTNFPGKMYYIHDDISNLLLFNNYNGFFSGIIHAFRPNQINDKYKNQMNVYFIINPDESIETIYGFEIQTRNYTYTCYSTQQIHREILTNVQLLKDINIDNTIGDRFVYREKNNIYSQLPLYIKEGDDELVTNSYQKAGCLNSMGTHYVRYINEWNNCDSIYWLTPFYHKSVLIGYIIILGNVEIDSFGNKFIENELNHKRWRYMKWQIAVFKTKQQSDFIDCDEPLLMQHVFFSNPYDIVCDFDDSIMDISYWITKVFISIKNNQLSETFVDLQLLMVHIIGQFMVPFNIANTFFDWDNLLTFQVKKLNLFDVASG
eukprot:402960_1